MPHDLKTLIPPLDEAGRAKRIQVEHKLLDRILKDLDNPELDQAEFRSTMRDYCELKKQDNLHEKNVLQLARLSRRPLPPSEQSRAVLSPVNGDSAPISDATSEFAIYDPELDPDVDPEWSLAPWGRRRNGQPRTEKEYRTILHRTVRDVYGLDLHDRGDRSTIAIATSVSTPPDPALPGTTDSETSLQKTDDSISDASHHDSHAHSPDTELATGPPPSPRQRVRRPYPGPLREPPGICGEPPFDPKPRNPWHNF